MSFELRKNEQGFTLIELLIAVVISGVILGGVTNGFLATMRGSKDMHDRFTQSHDSQLLAAYFPTDVQSADPTIGVDTSGATWAPCNAAQNPGGSVPNVLMLRWNETVATTTTSFAVSYRTRMVTAGPGENTRYELVRYFCSGTTVKPEVVAHSIALPGAGSVVVSGQNVTLNLAAVPIRSSSTAGNYSFSFAGRMRTPTAPPPYPRVSSITRKLATPNSLSTVTWRVIFDRAVTGVDLTDFTTTVTGLTGVGTPSVTPVSSTEYTVSVTTGSGSGAIELDLVDNNTIKDATLASLGGSLAADGNYAGQTYNIDRAAPVVSAIARAGVSPTSGPNISWTVDFNEGVSGVDAADFSAVRSGVTGGSTTVTQISASQYTVTIGAVTTPTCPSATNCTLGLNLVDNNSIVDNAGNALGGATAGDGNFTGQVFNVSGAAPAAPSITSVELKNKTGNTAGKLEKGDSVVVTFSAILKESSLCSIWTSGDGNDQSITAGNAVTVTVTDSGSADTLTVSSTSCTFNFGTLALAGDYVSQTVAFGGSGGNASAINWDATNHQLTITLGSDSPNNKTNTVASSQPAYTASPSVTDPYSQPVTPGTYNFPAAAKQF